MKIIIKSPEEYQEERAKLLEEAVELMAKQARSNSWYAKRMNVIRNKVIWINKKIGED